VYADISADTLNLDPVKTAAAVTPATRAILFQHTYGNLAGAADVQALANDRRLLLVEDCAQCLPASVGEFTPGRWGTAAIFSNNLMKPMATGSGGIAAIHDKALAARVRDLRGKSSPRSTIGELLRRAETLVHRYVLRPSLYWPLFALSRRISSNYRSRPVSEEITSEISACAYRISPRQVADGDAGLRRLANMVLHRQATCQSYRKALAGLPGIEMPAVHPRFPLYWFPLLTVKKETLLQAARGQRLPIMPWPIRTPIYPIVEESLLRGYQYEPGSCPVAEDVARRLVGLPTDGLATSRHVARVIGLVGAHHADGRR
jgi:dTDP-4-amino-4,6-dideoxygalactose transaminase